VNTSALATPATHDRWRVAIPRELSPAALFRPAGELQLLEGTAIGTSWRVTFVGTRAAVPAVRRASEQILDRIVTCFSPWEPNSELNHFNAIVPCAWHNASADFLGVMTSALTVAGETGGACDPALGTLVDLWGFGPGTRRDSPPNSVEIEQALGDSGWRHIVVDRVAGKISRKAPARLDLCGIAKGQAVDLIARQLREAGVASALVEIGGELSGYGIKPDGTPWWVAIDGDAAGQAPLLIALHGLAIATSGRERAFEHAGRTYSHTIDPRTGRPIDNGMVSASVLHASCMLADAYATALMVMGPERAIDFADARGLAAVIRFSSGGSVAERVSARLQAMLDG
jgi:thiamine biosynthesis lipoprotein